MGTRSPKLLDLVRGTLRIKHYAYRTEQAYGDRIERFTFFHGKRHPKDLEADEVQAYITYPTKE